jgi:hypothetical protein
MTRKVIYKPNEKIKQTTVSKGTVKEELLSKSDPAPPKKFPHGLSSALSIRYPVNGQTRIFSVYANCDRDKGLTTMISAHTNLVLGVVKTIERAQFIRAARWLVSIRVQIETLPELFVQVQGGLWDKVLKEDHFGMHGNAQHLEVRQGNLISLGEEAPKSRIRTAKQQQLEEDLDTED